MRGIVVGLLLAGLVGTASPALAQAPTCAGRLIETIGQPLDLKTPLDEPTRVGFSFGIAVGLDDSLNPAGLWPRDTIQAAPACAIRTFEAAGKRFTLSGGLGRVPPRFAVSDTGETLALTILPSISEAYAMQRTGTEGTVKVEHFISALVLLRPTRVFVLKLYDGLPADDALIEDMKAAAARTLPVLASFHSTSRAVSLNLPTISGRDAFFLRPPGPDNLAVITAADGQFFHRGEDGAVTMLASGMVCPATQDGFSRDDMLVVDTTDRGMDLACRFFGDAAWFSTFVTRFEDGRSEQAQFDEYLAQGRQAAPPVGEIVTDKMPRGGLRAVWRDARGQRQEMWLLRLGKWYVQVRITADPARATGIDDAATAILDIARRTIHEASA
ncbi:MAG TPA: hypothetical protein VNZ85_04975 [Caulobacter sp.]|nr:hypothetical protein [Caulobacter sp.]